MTTSDDLHVDDLHLPVSGAYTIQIQNVSSVHAPYAFSVTREAIGVPVSSDESSENSDDGGNVDSDGNTSANTGSVVTLSQQPQGALAWQPFERGVMMWFSGTNQIWVFFDTGNGAGYVRYYGDTFSGTNYEGWSENCSISPIRGFGRVYFENELYNDIGCAMSQEVGYQGANTPPSSGRLQVDGPGNTLYRVNRNNHTWVTVNAG